MEVPENKLEASGNKNNTKTIKNNTRKVFTDVSGNKLDVSEGKNNTRIIKNNTILVGFYILLTRNHTKLAAAFTVPAALLILLAQNNTVAAPNNNVPIVSPLYAAKTVQFTMTEIYNSQDDAGNPLTQFIIENITLQRPDKSLLLLSSKNTAGDEIQSKDVCDGKTSTSYDLKKKVYNQQPFVHKGDNFARLAQIPSVEPVSVLFNKRPCLLFAQPPDTHNKTLHFATRVWLSSKTLLPVREDMTEYHNGEQKMCYETDYSNWKLNPKLPISLFTFVPPPGSKLVPNDNRTP